MFYLAIIQLRAFHEKSFGSKSIISTTFLVSVDVTLDLIGWAWYI